jgi:uncharacterized protein YggT (Ycf19 family)
MAEVQQTIQRDSDMGATTVTKTTQTVPTQAEVQEGQAFKFSQIIWYVVGLVEVILLLRVIFLLLAAGRTGFTLTLYNLTQPLVSPFQGIFPAPTVQGGYFDSAAVVAMVIYALIGLAIVSLINLSRRPSQA